MTDPRRLPERLIEPEAFSVERGFQALVRRRDERRKSEQRRHRMVAGMAVAACVMLLVIQLRRPQADAPISASKPLTLTAAEQTETRSFEDGSVLTLAPHARLTTLGASVRRVSARVDQGQVTFDLEPLPSKRWDIDASFAQVQASDARFVVDRSDHALRVQVLRGAVLVYAAELPEGRLRVTEGQTVRVPEARRAEPVLSRPRGQAVKAQLSEAPSAKVPSSSAAAVAAPSRTAAPRAPTPAPITADALLAAADSAREGRRWSDAHDALTHLVEQFPHDRRVGMAAFTLGKISLEAQSEPGVAARWFRLALARGVPGMLAEDAVARLVEALAKSGDQAAAVVARDRYLADYPTGRYVRQVQAWAP